MLYGVYSRSRAAGAVVLLLAQEGLLSIEEVYTDGTKIDANANRYTFVGRRRFRPTRRR